MRYLFCLFLFPFIMYSQNLTDKEQNLYSLLNAYRAQHNLPPIPLSKNLCRVAKLHAEDLVKHRPKGKCNLHSWSADGNWSAVCYTNDHKNANGMWIKPQELTSYPAYGYEIAFWSSDTNLTANEALNGWKQSVGHNNCIINKKQWKNTHWQAIGISIYKNYALVWFGEEIDH